MERAIGAAQWTAAAARELAAAATLLDPQQRAAVYEKLAAAINEDRIEVHRDALGL